MQVSICGFLLAVFLFQLPFVQPLREYLQFLPALVKQLNIIVDLCAVNLVSPAAIHHCFSLLDHIRYIWSVVWDVVLEGLRWEKKRYIGFPFGNLGNAHGKKRWSILQLVEIKAVLHCWRYLHESKPCVRISLEEKLADNNISRDDIIQVNIITSDDINCITTPDLCCNIIIISNTVEALLSEHSRKRTALSNLDKPLWILRLQGSFLWSASWVVDTFLLFEGVRYGSFHCLIIPRWC